MLWSMNTQTLRLRAATAAAALLVWLGLAAELQLVQNGGQRRSGSPLPDSGAAANDLRLQASDLEAQVMGQHGKGRQAGWKRKVCIFLCPVRPLTR